MFNLLKGIFSSVLVDIKSSFDTIIRYRYVSTLLTIAAIGISIAIPAFFYCLAHNLQNVLKNDSLGKNITAYVEGEVSKESLNQLVKSIKEDPRIDNVQLILNSEGIEDFAKLVGISKGDILDDGVNPLPHAIIITPKEAYTTSDEIEKLALNIGANKVISTIKLDKDWFLKINNVLSLLNFLTYLLGTILVVSLFLTITNSISSRVLLHSEEIEVMKLVGATDLFICKPYAYMGMWFGLCGAFCGWWFTVLSLYLVNQYIVDLTKMYGIEFTMTAFSFGGFLELIISFMIISALISVLSAKRAITRIEPK